MLSVEQVEARIEARRLENQAAGRVCVNCGDDSKHGYIVYPEGSVRCEGCSDDFEEIK